MICSEVTELMQRHLDHDLTESEQQTMVAHFHRCPECASLFERLQQVSDELEALPAVMPPFSIVDSILPQLMTADAERDAVIAAPGAPAAPAAPSRRFQRRMPSWLLPAGTAAAALFLGVFLFRDMDIINRKDAAKTSGNSAASSNAMTESASGAKTPDPDASENRAAPETNVQAMMDQPGTEGTAPTESESPTAFVAPEGPGSKDLSDGNAKQLAPDSEATAVPAPSSDAARYFKKGTVQKFGGSPSPDEEDSPSIRGIDVPPPVVAPPRTIDEGNTTTFNPDGQSAAGVMKQPEKAGEPTLQHELASPDGSLTGLVVEESGISDRRQRVVIRHTAGEILFKTKNSWKINDRVSLSKWLDGSRLLYTVHMENGGTYQSIIDVAAAMEYQP